MSIISISCIRIGVTSQWTLAGEWHPNLIKLRVPDGPRSTKKKRQTVMRLMHWTLSRQADYWCLLGVSQRGTMYLSNATWVAGPRDRKLSARCDDNVVKWNSSLESIPRGTIEGEHIDLCGV